MVNSDNEYEIHVVDEDIPTKEVPSSVVVIPILNSPIFPGMIAPIILTEDKFTPELEKTITKIGYVGLNLVKSMVLPPELKNGKKIEPVIESKLEKENKKDNKKVVKKEEKKNLIEPQVSPKDIYKVGVLCKVVKKLKLPDGSVNILVHGLRRYQASDIYQENQLMISKVEVFEDIVEADEELDAYTRTIINQVKKLSEINPYFNEEMKLAMLNSPSPGSLADLVAFSLSLDVPEVQDFLETFVVKKRFAKLLVYMRREKDVADIQKKITDEVNDKVTKYQKEYFLREQLKVIRNELGMEEDDKAREVKKFKENIDKIGMNADAKKVALEEMERLETIPDSSPEYNVTRTYLNWLFSLPWNKSTEDQVDIEKTKKILAHDHYGLTKAKDRILEFLAVRKLKPQFDGSILCFMGPPGVGKTSLGNSIAKALGRKFYRISLGGVRDESEIKGHRRTYVGAMPGKLINAMKRVEVNNPVIMLDEIDKLGKSFQGDPSSALLEILDPEQNSNFIDSYLDVPYDLSKVLFIATGNYLDDVPEPLQDRMEIIELSGYTLEEKLSIANRWLIPRELKKHGLTKSDVSFSQGVLKKLIHDYAREPGVRVMDQYIAKLCRKAALNKVTTKSKKKFVPTVEELEKMLGAPRFQSEVVWKEMKPGLVTGLAWTAYGGEILVIESIPLIGKGFKLTGQLGGVMNESANLAYSYVKKMLQDELAEQEKKKKPLNKRAASSIETKTENKDGNGRKSDESLDFIANHEIHLHLPAGATPKDGPSAGISMALALYSLATNKKVKSGLAMTGELSLTGRVLPVGGIKEKVLAAKRAGIKEIILPKQNAKDLNEVPELHRKGMKFYPVATFDEVLKIGLK